MTRTGLIIAVLLLSTAPAFPASDDTKIIHMVCTGDRMLPGLRIQQNVTLSLTVDMNVGVETVTVGGYRPMGILPETPGSNDDVLTLLAVPSDTTSHVMLGSLNRITGELHVDFNFHKDAPVGKQESFAGTCKPTQKLF